MKKITLALSAVLVLIITSCQVNGIDGLDGLDGQDGLDAPLSKVIDIEGDFTLENDYSIFYEFESDIEVFETDIVLVYILFDQTVDTNGEAVDIWRLLPQTRILDQGLLQYNSDHTFFDVNIFLESDFDLSTLLAGDTDNQIFRIAVIPAETTGKSSLDTSDMNAVLSTLDIEENDIRKIEL